MSRHKSSCAFVRSCGMYAVMAMIGVYDLPLSMFVASSRLVSIMCVWVLYPYYWVRVVFRVLWLIDASSCVSAFRFATSYMCRLYLGWCWCWVVCVCGIVAMC